MRECIFNELNYDYYKFSEQHQRSLCACPNSVLTTVNNAALGMLKVYNLSRVVKNVEHVYQF